MAKIELILPKMGESVAEATIIKWLKNEGDKVENDEFIVEIATDKVDSEIPSTQSGVLIQKLYKENDVVEVGKPFAIIESENEDEEEEVNSVEKEEKLTEDNLTKESVTFTEKLNTPSNEGERTKFYSPLIKSIAKQENLSIETLDTIVGSGEKGRVTKKDVLNFIENKKTTTKNTSQPLPSKSCSVIDSIITPDTLSKEVIPKKGEEIIEMSRMRKLIADHMVESKKISPHVTSFVEADVTGIVNQRAKIKDSFLKKYGEKLTFTPIFIKAIVDAIKEFPMVNVSIVGDKIIKKQNINIGMATALPNGNLIVPVIKNADTLNLIGLAKAVNDLARRARENKLNPDDITNGTYTITNVGSFGNIMGTPIINQPQVAILALGAIRKKPAVIETTQGDLIGVRQMMFLSHSYDHRIVDGALGGLFVNKVGEILKTQNLNQLL